MTMIRALVAWHFACRDYMCASPLQWMMNLPCIHATLLGDCITAKATLTRLSCFPLSGIVSTVLQQPGCFLAPSWTSNQTRTGGHVGSTWWSSQNPGPVPAASVES